MIKKIDHIVITTENIDKCLSFYEAIGFEIKKGNGRYELFAGDFKINVHIKGQELMPNAKKATPGSADICFELQGSIDEFSYMLRAKNIKTELVTVERSGVLGSMKSIYIRDTDGNLLEFSSYKK